jgi:hypothetical protein
MTYTELQGYLVDKYGDKVKTDGSITSLYSNARYDEKVKDYIGFMNSILTNEEYLYDRLIKDKDLDNLNIYKVDSVFSLIGDLDVLYNNGLLWANGVNRSLMIDNYEFEYEKCRIALCVDDSLDWVSE